MSCWAVEQVQDSSRSETGSSVDQTAPDGQEQDRQVVTLTACNLLILN